MIQVLPVAKAADSFFKVANERSVPCYNQGTHTSGFALKNSKICWGWLILLAP